MTIATSLFYDRSRDAMAALSSKTDLLNTQISTGKKIQAPSDDPLSYSRLRSITTQTADADAYAGNLKIASASLASADTALSSITDQITQARALATQAANGTLNADDRRAIGEQLAGIAQTLVSLAGTQDQSGHPLFGDTTGGAAVTQNADGSFFREFRFDDGQPATESKTSTLHPVRFLIDLSCATGEKRYLDAAMRAGEWSLANNTDGPTYVGGTPDNPDVIDKEAGWIAFDSYLALYDVTQDQRWLDEERDRLSGSARAVRS